MDSHGRTSDDPLYQWTDRLSRVDSDEFPDPIPTVPLACGHMGTITTCLIAGSVRWWCCECLDYNEPKGE